MLSYNSLAKPTVVSDGSIALTNVSTSTQQGRIVLQGKTLQFRLLVLDASYGT